MKSMDISLELWGFKSLCRICMWALLILVKFQLCNLKYIYSSCVSVISVCQLFKLSVNCLCLKLFMWIRCLFHWNIPFTSICDWISTAMLSIFMYSCINTSSFLHRQSTHFKFCNVVNMQDFPIYSINTDKNLLTKLIISR